MSYKIPKPKKEKPIFIKEPYGLPQDLTPTGTFKVEKEEKKDPKKLFLEEIKKKDTITEKEISLIKRRLNDGTYKSDEVYEMIGEDGKALTSEQQEKGKAWLMDKWKSSTGKERENNPFGYREQEILDKFKGIRLKEFYDAGNYGFHNYTPYYEVEGNETSFEYVVKGGEVSILG